MRTLKISNTLQVLCGCWTKAEESLQLQIASTSPDIDEEIITQRFHTTFAENLDTASRSRRIERSFLKDLEHSFPQIDDGDLRRIAHGIIANVTLHKRSTEKATGGDLGIMIIRPQVSFEYSLLRIADYRRGLLAQAKLRKPNGKWNRLTRKQEQNLIERTSYLALLLYNYSDFARRNLEAFRWQLCNGIRIEMIQQLLKADNFPETTDSSTILKALGSGTIGTDNNQILDEIVAPRGNSSLIIQIKWPDDCHPGSHVRVYTRREQPVRIAARH